MKSSFSAIPRSLLVPTIFISLFAVLWTAHTGFRPRSTGEYVCGRQAYRTEILSVDPLVIYINDFISSDEAKGLIEVGSPNLAPSLLTHPNTPHKSRDPNIRTSSSGALPPSEPVVSCILSRASSFLGHLIPLPLSPPNASALSTLNENVKKTEYLQEIFGLPQIVKYEKGQKFDLHHDWFDDNQPLKSPLSSFPLATENHWRKYNRVASFFVYLSAPPPSSSSNEPSGGETWFPYISPPLYTRGKNNKRDGDRRSGEEGAKWKAHKEGGIAFKPIQGNAIFWVNLNADGTGDERVVHAGLEVGEGGKVAMNIWPRRFF